MRNFELYMPTKIIFGKNTTEKIGPEAAFYGKKALLLYGRESARKTGLLGRVERSLSDSGISFFEYGGVRSNPVLSFANTAVKFFRQNKLDMIVAVGGGSVIDTAKTIAAGALYGGDVWDFFEHRASVERAVPITAVLTLAASGSEMNGGAVITNEDTSQKTHMISELLFPKVSVLDPENTFSVPRDYSMYGAVDAIAHVLEGYFNYEDPYTPIQDRMVESLVTTTMEAADAVFADPLDYPGRANLMWGATLALNGLTQSGVGSTGFPMHMIEHSLSALYDIAHGAGLGIVIPAWMRHDMEGAGSVKYAQFAERVFDVKEGSVESKALTGISRLEEWFASRGVPVRLADAGIPAGEIEKIARNVSSLADLWGLKTYTDNVVKDILGRAA